MAGVPFLNEISGFPSVLQSTLLLDVMNVISLPPSQYKAFSTKTRDFHTCRKKERERESVGKPPARDHHYRYLLLRQPSNNFPFLVVRRVTKIWTHFTASSSSDQVKRKRVNQCRLILKPPQFVFFFNPSCPDAC